MDASPIELELTDVTVETVTAGGRRCLEHVNWRIIAGEFWVVGGLPGSGKTMLLETAAGLRPTAAGTRTAFGRQLELIAEEQARAARRRIGFVYGRGGRLFSHLTLAQNIALPLCYHRNCPGDAVATEVNELLTRYGLRVFAERLPGQVNPAYRQRAALVRALALKPEVLFLDDPLAELNTAQIRWWLDLLSGGKPRTDDAAWPRTWVVATDDLRPWLALGRQFALLEDHHWRVLGGRDDLANAREPLVRELLAESLAAG